MKAGLGWFGVWAKKAKKVYSWLVKIIKYVPKVSNRTSLLSCERSE